LDERRPDVIVLGAGVMGLTTGVCLAERGALPANERQALYNAIAKLQAIGPALGYPHTSAVQGTAGLRDLRPRGGRSPWRGLYRQVGERFVIAAIALEAQHDSRRFKRACMAARRRLDELEE